MPSWQQVISFPFCRLHRDGRNVCNFAEWNYAHRGLWNAAEGVPENSLPAFARAAEQGYAIELDIQITKDGRIVVFHDDTMKRMCGNEGKISDYTYEELQQFHLGDSTEKDSAAS